MRLTILTRIRVDKGAIIKCGRLAINPTSPNLILTPAFVGGKLHTALGGVICTEVEGTFDEVVQQINDDMKA